jgi:hypothetical protein
MKAAKISMGARARRAQLSRTLLAAGLTALIVGTATAQVSPVSPRNAVVRAQHAGPSPKVVSRAHQPVGTPHKVSSFAPHPTKRRVFGAPIQPPIVSNVPAPPPKKTAPK